MLRRLSPIIAVFTLVLFLVFPISTVKADSTSTATTEDSTNIDSLGKLDSVMSNTSGLNKDLQEYCKKRQGNQMNLETWYSGKCTPGGDTFSGDNVGFADMVILDLAEKLSGSNDPTQTFSGTLKGVFDQLSQSTSPEQQQLAIDDARQKLIYDQNTGLVGQSGKLIALLYQNQPASTQSYISHLAQNLQNHKIIPSAFAATSSGTGFQTFAPFLTIWEASRNLAYLGLVVFFIVYGFMMMFRVNLGQKTVITIQLAIPKLIVTLLVITFSYAIVGLIYDFMWVAIYFIFNYLASQNLIVYGPVWHPAVAAAGNSGILLSLTINGLISGPAAIFGVLNLILGGTAASAGTIVGYLPFAGGINFIIGLIVLIAVLISYGKLLFKLIGAFVSVIVSLIIGPITLLGNAFPGSQAIGNWFRGVLANLAVFPATMLFLLFSYLLMVQPIVGICTEATQIFKDPNTLPTGTMSVCEKVFGVKSLVSGTGLDTSITGVPLIAPPFNAGFNSRGLLALVGIGLLLMASKYVDMIKDALKAPAFKYGAAIGEALKGGWKGGGLAYGDEPWYQGASDLFNLPKGKQLGPRTGSSGGPDKNKNTSGSNDVDPR